MSFNLSKSTNQSLLSALIKQKSLLLKHKQVGQPLNVHIQFQLKLSLLNAFVASLKVNLNQFSNLTPHYTV